MQDRELVLRYLALHYLGADAYKDETMDNYLNKAMEFINQQDNIFLEDCTRLYFSSLNYIHSIFGKNVFRRISKIKPNDLKTLNTALFEGWMNAIVDLTEEERILLIVRKEALVELYIVELDKKALLYSDIGSGKYRSFVRRNDTIKRIIQEVLDDDKKNEN